MGYVGASAFEKAIAPILDVGIFTHWLYQSRTPEEFCTRSVELAFHGLTMGTAITGTGDVGGISGPSAGAILAGQLMSEKLIKINSELAMQKAIGEVLMKNPNTRSVVEAFIAAHTLVMQFISPFSSFKILYHIKTLVMTAIPIPICFYQLVRERTKSYTGERFFYKIRPQISKLSIGN